MRRLRFAVDRKWFAATSFFIGALVIGLGASSTVVGSARSGSPSLPLHRGAGSSGFTFYTVNDKPNKNNYVTGINSSNDIVGAYDDSGTYYSFFATPPSSTTFNYTFQSQQYSSGTPLYSTFMQGLTDNASNPHEVGYAVQSNCLTCPTLGLVYHSGSGSPWTVITDPHQGTTPCNLTVVLGMNDSRAGVGYYEKNTTSGCTQQAFEFYCPEQGNTCNGPYQYFDMSPLGPGSAKPMSSSASGINGLGDVTGTLTMSNGQMYGWFYAELKYNYFSIGSFNTYSRGINFDDTVVGSYTNNGTTYGFLVTKPQNASPAYATISNNSAYVTVASSINLTIAATYTISGWFQPTSTSKVEGFVATCSVSSCAPSGSAARLDRLPIAHALAPGRR